MHRYALLHQMLRESRFGINVFPLMRAHGRVKARVGFEQRGPGSIILTSRKLVP